MRRWFLRLPRVLGGDEDGGALSAANIDDGSNDGDVAAHARTPTGGISNSKFRMFEDLVHRQRKGIVKGDAPKAEAPKDEAPKVGNALQKQEALLKVIALSIVERGCLRGSLTVHMCCRQSSQRMWIGIL